jgi:hypothetical protein
MPIVLSSFSSDLAVLSRNRGVGWKMESVWDRAVRVFAAAGIKIVAEQRAMHARQTKDHLLQSGKTLRVAARIYEDETAAAIDLATDAVGRRNDDRGRAWRREMQDVRDALAVHAAKAIDLVSSTTRIAAPADGVQLITPLIEEANKRLAQRVDDYAEGWTSPKGKRWHERHPALYGMAMMIVGAIITAAAGLLVVALKAPPGHTPQPVATVSPPPKAGANHRL